MRGLAALVLLAAPLLAEDARQILSRNCYACHSQTKMGGLRLDSRDGILRGGNSGPAVVPGDADKSLLIQAVRRTHARFKMPPTGPLKPEEVESLVAWVKAGADWPAGSVTYWAFQPVKRPQPPAVRQTGWVKNEIDRFVLAKLEEKGLRPGAAAPQRVLLRRVFLDLTGLPPAPEDYSLSYEEAVEKLLASPQYGERWARHWLDVARYSDDALNSTQDEPYANSFRYRNWVIRALNDDMPYNLFVKAQIAGDQLGKEYEAGTGFFSLSPEFQDDRVDALTRGLLGLTVACAQCHDHKYDPIPTKDFYALQGVFDSTEKHETPLESEDVVKQWQARKKELDKQQETLDRFYRMQTDQVAEMLATSTASYVRAARGLGSTEGLDAETLERWRVHLKRTELADDADQLQTRALAVLEDKRRVDKENEIRLGLDPSREDLANANLVSLPRDKYAFWRDLFGKGEKDSAGFFSTPDGVYYYGKEKVERFLEGLTKQYLEQQKAKLEELKKALPPQYAFLHSLRDVEKPQDIPVAIRGDRNNKGEIAPRGFPAVLCNGQPKRFTKGSGRFELAEAVAAPDNPLTARVIVNRLWQFHFGRGIVATASNFGLLGERPSHPELLDYLAARLVEDGWSLKRLHRDILLSATYRESAAADAANEKIDPENRLLWRTNRQRMDIETIRDSLLFVSGQLDPSPGEKAEPLDEKNRRRTIYGFVSRRRLDPVLGLFDFPNPNNTAEQRVSTNIPTQRLFFMNSPFVEEQAKEMAGRLKGSTDERIEQAYRLVYGRKPAKDEVRLAMEFLKNGDWTGYARVLLSSNEFLYVE